MAHPGGRPPKYKKEFGDLLYKHMSEGLSFSSFAAVVDVWKSTLDEWCHSHPEFSVAKKKGREAQLLFYEKFGRGAMSGKIPGFNATAFVWMTKNMLGWRDKQDIDHKMNLTNEQLVEIIRPRIEEPTSDS